MKQSPQLENGYTRFANEWLDAMLRADYPGAVKEFVFAIARETWGWNETWREIPAPRLAEILGVTVSRVKQLRADAQHWCLICWEPGQGHSSSGRYRVQKDPRDWAVRRVTGKWAELHTGKDGLSGQDGISGDSVLSGQHVLPTTGQDGLSSDRIGRAIHLKDSSKDTLKTNDSQSARAGAPAPQPTYPDADTLTQQQQHMDACNNSVAAAAWAYWQDGRAPGGRDNWSGQLVAAMRIEAKQPDPLTDAEVIDAFKRTPPLPSEWPDAWLARLRVHIRGDPRKPKRLLGTEPADRSAFAEE